MNFSTKLSHQQQIIKWLQEQPLHLAALKAVADLSLPDCYISAGFVRNLVWDKRHLHQKITSFNDVDVIYYDPKRCTSALDIQLEQLLKQKLDLPWSVKNQARMHKRNHHKPYKNTLHAMTFWPEIQTAVAVKWDVNSQSIHIISGFGLDCLFDDSLAPNPNHDVHHVLLERMHNKGWLTQWPKLKCSNLQIEQGDKIIHTTIKENLHV